MNATISEEGVSSVAHPVQGLVCVHGYTDTALRTLPAPGVFASIEAFTVTIKLRTLQNSNASPVIRQCGNALPTNWESRMREFISIIFGRFNVQHSCIVDIEQNFDSAIGLGSSAAIYAALTVALTYSLQKELSTTELSLLARLGSYSAAASITGNISRIDVSDRAEENYSKVICDKDVFPYRIIVLPVSGKKESEQIHSEIVKSPYYSTWLSRAQLISERVSADFRKGLFSAAGNLIESFIFDNQAAISTGPNNLVLWSGHTLQRILILRRLRIERDLSFFISMNSGPAVFIYALPDELPTILEELNNAGIDYVISNIGGAAIGRGFRAQVESWSPNGH